MEILLVDQRFRPIVLGPEGERSGAVLIFETGKLFVTDGEGVLRVSGLTPGTYRLYLDAPDYEAVPAQVDVVAGEYAESMWLAHDLRGAGAPELFVEEHVVYQSCTVHGVVTILRYDCTNDRSWSTVYPTQLEGTTTQALVVEFQANQPARYLLSVLCTDSQGDAIREYCASASFPRTDAARAWMTYEEGTLRHHSEPWGGRTIEHMSLYYSGEDLPGPVDGNPLPVGLPGVQVGFRANLLVSQFLTPVSAEDVEGYCVACVEGS